MVGALNCLSEPSVERVKHALFGIKEFNEVQYMNQYDGFIRGRSRSN